jgi:single-strand DNA-binding protein
MGLATNRSWKTENGEIREEAEFHRLVAWNKLGELCSQLCSKGRKIYVKGRLQTRTFTGSDNAQHTITEIVIDDMILLDSKISGTAQGSYQGQGGGYANVSVPRPAQNHPNAVSPQPSSAPAVVDDSAPVAGETGQVAEKPVSAKGKKKTVVADEKVEVAQEQPLKEDVNIDDIPF